MKKPFELGSGGVLGDLGLTLSQKKSLELHLDKNMSKSDKNQFLDGVSLAIDRTYKSLIFYGNEAQAVKRIESFSMATHSMAIAIDGLRASNLGRDQDPFQYLAIYFDESLFLANPNIKLQEKWVKNKPKLDDILNEIQTNLADLEKLADYTLSKIKVSKGSRPDVVKARLIAINIIEEYQKKFNKLPSISRGHWFANFMYELGKLIRLDIGDRVLRFAKDQFSTQQSQR